MTDLNKINREFQDAKNLDKFGGKIEEIFGAKRRKQNDDEDDINGEAPSPISHQKMSIQCKLKFQSKLMLFTNKMTGFLRFRIIFNFFDFTLSNLNQTF